MSERRESVEESSLAKRTKAEGANGKNGDSNENPCDLLDRIDRGDRMLDDFARWLVKSITPAFSISKKIYMGIRGSAANYGMIALEDIEAGEEIFRIPLERTLSWENLLIADRLRPEIEKMAVANRWTPLILAIMLEDGLVHSRWTEYLQLFLRTNELSIPLLWDEDALNQMQGLSIAQRVKKDRAQIAADFKKWIFPVLLREQNLNESSFDVLLKEAYRVAAFIMSYSFTRPSNEELSGIDENIEDDESDVDEEATVVGNALAEVPLMIPLADILNASVHKNNAKLHWNEAEEKFLTMIATKLIPKGSEVFNTYGEISSEEMLYLYGYVEAGLPNPHEEVFIPSEYLKDVVEDMKSEGLLVFSSEEMDKRVEYLLKRKTVGSDFPVVLGMEGILSDDDFHLAIRVITMTDEEFNEEVQMDELTEMDSMAEKVYSIDNLKSLPVIVKQILKRLIKRKLADYPQSQQEYEAAAHRASDLLRSDVGADMAHNGVNVMLARRPFYMASVKLIQLQLLDEYLAKLA